MTISSVAPEQTQATPKHHPAKPIAKATDNGLAVSGTSFTTESYQANKDGDSYEFQYNKTEYASYSIDKEALNPTAEGLLGDFDINEFQENLKSQLIDMVFNASDKAKEANANESLIAKFGTDVVYEVPEGTEVAEVPEYWNAENTSDRLVDFAMSFKDVAGYENDAEYIEEIRDAVVEGFRQAKGIIGNVDDSTHKLFNDTLNLTMQKFDALLEEAQATTESQVRPQPVDMVA